MVDMGRRPPSVHRVICIHSTLISTRAHPLGKGLFIGIVETFAVDKPAYADPELLTLPQQFSGLCSAVPSKLPNAGL